MESVCYQSVSEWGQVGDYMQFVITLQLTVTNNLSVVMYIRKQKFMPRSPEGKI